MNNDIVISYKITFTEKHSGKSRSIITNDYNKAMGDAESMREYLSDMHEVRLHRVTSKNHYDANGDWYDITLVDKTEIKLSKAQANKIFKVV